MDLKNHHFELTDEGVAILLMDRHDEAMNTLGEEFVLELESAVTRLEEEDVKAVVIGSSNPIPAFAVQRDTAFPSSKSSE